MIRFAALKRSGGFGMADSEDNWPSYDTYFPGSPKHLHAVGVIASCYNAFERLIFELYLHHVDRNKIPHSISVQFYLSRDDGNRLALINSVFQTYEKKERVRQLLENLTNYFRWCADVRNTILHGEVIPSFFADKHFHRISKRRGKKSAEMGYLSINLPSLRDYADKIQDGRLQAAKIMLHLHYRDTPPTKRSFSLRNYGLEPLPQTLDVPNPIRLLERLYPTP
jgi:hypothetical protein